MGITVGSRAVSAGPGHAVVASGTTPTATGRPRPADVLTATPSGFCAAGVLTTRFRPAPATPSAGVRRIVVRTSGVRAD